VGRAACPGDDSLGQQCLEQQLLSALQLPALELVIRCRKHLSAAVALQQGWACSTARQPLNCFGRVDSSTLAAALLQLHFAQQLSLTGLQRCACAHPAANNCCTPTLSLKSCCFLVMCWLPAGRHERRYICWKLEVGQLPGNGQRVASSACLRLAHRRLYLVAEHMAGAGGYAAAVFLSCFWCKLCFFVLNACWGSNACLGHAVRCTWWRSTWRAQVGA
jgi:hypothetical protein